MWVYRPGLARAKYHALTGEWVSGEEAARIELISQSVPPEDLDQTVQGLAEKLARIPLTQLISMKLIVRQAYENMGLQSTQTLGPILDGIMRNTPEGSEGGGVCIDTYWSLVFQGGSRVIRRLTVPEAKSACRRHAGTIIYR